MKNVFKNLGKSPSQIHKPNLYAQSLDETKSKGMYEKSVEALSPTTYQVANKQNFLFAKWYANLYHFVSAGLGLATVIALAFIFSGAGAGSKYPTWLLYGIFGLTFIILCALLFGIEIFKSSLAKGIFKNLVVGSKVGVTAVIGLVLVMLFSILVSAIGGMVLSYEMNDKSTQINEIYSVQSDSIRKLHDESLQAVNASIKAYQSNLNKGNYWAKYATREKLDKAIDKRNNLLATAKGDITGVQAAKDKAVNLNSSEGKNFAVISAITVLFLEILSILAYWFQYVYHRNCEREATNFEILSPTMEIVNSTTNTSKSELSEIKDLLQSLLSGNHNLQLASNTVQPGSSKVGFSFGVNNNPTLKVNGEGITVKVAECRPEKEYIQLGTNERVCKHCNTKFSFKHWNATYCGEKCKIEAWEKKTGKKFNKKKGGK